MSEDKKRESAYSGRKGDDIVTGHDNYNVRQGYNPPERRRYARIPCRSIKACIRTQYSTSVVDVLNMSRCGMFFSSMQQFSPGSSVSIAMHYMEGGQNMFQKGRIVREQPREKGTDPRQFAAEFSLF